MDEQHATTSATLAMLLPELQSGLTMVVHAHQVQQIQLNDEAPWRRPAADHDRDSSTAGE